MWDDVVIGTGDRGNGAVIVEGCRGENRFSISHNKVSYWISNIYMDFGAVVFKNTPEGEELKKRIKAQDNISDIQHWLAKIVLPKVDPERLMSRIKYAIQRAEEKGRKQKSKEILLALTSE